MDRVLRMLLAGMGGKEIRADLDLYLATQKQSGGEGIRGEKSYGMAIGILASWFDPDNDLLPFRDAALTLASSMRPAQWLALHWAVISASYPFWFNVAMQTGRLFNLQDQITQAQVFNRIKERYGDRVAVARNARYTVRSFVAWKVINDTKSKGCYGKASPLIVNDSNLAVLLLESALYASPEGKGALNVLLKNPAFFPFSLPSISGDTIVKQNPRIEVVRFGLDEELLKLKNV